MSDASSTAATNRGFSAIAQRLRAAIEQVVEHDPNPADPLRGLYITEETALRLARAETPDTGPDGRLQGVASVLGLEGLDIDVLAACAAPEVEPRYGRLFAYLQDDVTRRLATPRLVARLLEDDERPAARVLERFGAAAPLRSLGVLRHAGGEDEAGRPLADRLVKVADPVAALLLGADVEGPADPHRLWRLEQPPEVGRPRARAQLRALADGFTTLIPAAIGPDAIDVAAAARSAPVWVASAAALDADLLAEARLRAALEGTWLIIHVAEVLPPDQRHRVGSLLTDVGGPLLLASRTRDELIGVCDGSLLMVDVPASDAEERRRAWRALAGSGDTDDVAAKFQLGPRQIAQAAELARATAHADGRGAPTPADLDTGARSSSSNRLGELAHRLEAGVGWDRLVLPSRSLELLQSIAAYLRHRDLVLTDWGFAGTVGAMPGIKALFAGESGTGKTMAAQVLAADLGLDIFRIDLATVVSKYIGETEKNLDRVFAAAEGSNAILFFDEADALFGKRSEVGDAHDRYANIEVAYLLQKMEGYTGAVLLATNFRHNIDEAFLRRIDVLVDFPFPEPPERGRIWALVLPDGAPVDGDLDLGFLAERFRLSGGGIRNAALAGAFLAANESAPIAMRHLVNGVAREYTKLGRLTLEADFERFHAGL